MSRINRVMALLCAVSPLLLGFILPGTVERMCVRGNRLYRAQQYEKAEQVYAQALAARPGDPTLLYNRGTALYQMGKFDAAAQTLSAALADAPKQLQRDLHYNLGNSFYRGQQLERAIEQYKQALRLDPNDEDARYNLEMALKQQEKQQQKQQQQQEQQQQQRQQQQPQNQQQSQDQQEQQRQQEQDQQQQRQQQQQSQAEQDEGQGQDEQSQAPQDQQQEEGAEGSTQEQPMSREQAEQLLRALRFQDAELQKIIRRVPTGPPRTVTRDW